MQKVKVAVIGYGYLGKWHVEKVKSNPNAELIAIVERNSTKRESLTTEFSEIKVVETIEEVVNDIDAGIVVTTTSSHYDCVKFLLSKMKHVFCEKPLVTDISQAEELQKLTLDSNVIVQVGHSERCHEAWEILSEEKYKPFYSGKCHFNITRVAPFKGRATDVDVVQDLMIHDLDIINLFIDSSPSKIKATGFKAVSEHWDHVVASLEYGKGVTAEITSSRIHTEEIRKLEIASNSGVISVDLMNNQINVAFSDREKQVETIKYSKRDHLMIEQEDFYLSILERKSPKVGIKEGVEAVRNVNLVLNSLH